MASTGPCALVDRGLRRSLLTRRQSGRSFLYVTVSDKPQHRPIVNLDFRPNVAMVTSTRKFVSDLLDSIQVDADATSRVALATHELLENILKHSLDGHARLDVLLDETQDGYKIAVRLCNRADAARIDDVRRRVESLARAEDPMPVYLQLMLESAEREDGSGLGLARIRAEADMELSCDVDGDLVTIVASTDACREQSP